MFFCLIKPLHIKNIARRIAFSSTSYKTNVHEKDPRNPNFNLSPSLFNSLSLSIFITVSFCSRDLSQGDKLCSRVVSLPRVAKGYGWKVIGEGWRWFRRDPGEGLFIIWACRGRISSLVRNTEVALVVQIADTSVRKPSDLPAASHQPELLAPRVYLHSLPTRCLISVLI